MNASKGYMTIKFEGPVMQDVKPTISKEDRKKQLIHCIDEVESLLEQWEEAKIKLNEARREESRINCALANARILLEKAIKVIQQ